VLKVRILGAAVSALVCAALLASCSLLPDIPSPGNDDSGEKANAQMQRIADAVKHDDTAALKEVFSPRARDKAPNLESGLKYFLSVFHSAEMTWESEGAGGTGQDGPGDAWETFANYDVTANGRKYDLHFAYVETDTDHPENLGIYGLGATLSTANPYAAIGAPSPFTLWASQYGLDTDGVVIGTPGVYMPGMRGTVLSVTGPPPAIEMQHIADAVESHDPTALKKLFSPSARENATDLDSGLIYFLSVFPSGRLTWKSEGNPECYQRGGYQTATVEMCAFYKVTANGKVYDVYFAEFTVNQPLADHVGLYALGAGPSSANQSNSKQKFDVWAAHFGVNNSNEITGAPGVYVPRG
jgi:hypothetical protein